MYVLSSKNSGIILLISPLLFYLLFLFLTFTGDEWVPESRMLKLNEDNLAKQKALVESVKAAQEAKAKDQAGPRKSGIRDTSEVTDGGDRRKQKESRGTKRGRDTVEQVCLNG